MVGRFGFIIGWFRFMIGRFRFMIGRFGFMIGWFGFMMGRFGFMIGRFGFMIGRFRFVIDFLWFMVFLNIFWLIIISTRFKVHLFRFRMRFWVQVFMVTWMGFTMNIRMVHMMRIRIMIRYL